MSSTAAEHLSAQQLLALREQIAAYAGIYLDDTRTAALEAAIQRRASALSLTPLRYALGLSNDVAELQRLAEMLLNHETQFFRNRPHMQALRDVLLPELHRRLPPGAPLRLWSAGCATGEEPYSLAITALEVLGSPPARPVTIWATDLSEQALSKARAGLYRGRSLANLSPQQRSRYFVPRGADLAVAEPVRELVQFAQFNLLDPFPAQARGLHAIFCQNVTIYFQLSTCRMLMERFYQTLADDGLLFLGFSETLWNIYDRFRWREVAGAYVYYKASQPAQPAPANPLLRRERGTAVLDRPNVPVTRAPRLNRPVVPTRPLFAASEVVAQGRDLLNTGQAEAALELFYAAPLVGAQAPQILALAAQAHANRGDLDLAAAEARRALELNPLTMEAYVLVGLIYAGQGRYAAAISQLERARYLDGDSPLIAFHLAECYRQVGKAADALREYRNTLRKLADHPPDRLIDGVAVGWLSETCQHYATILGGKGV